MVIVVSHPGDALAGSAGEAGAAGPIAAEAALINALFDEELELFHLRKPEASSEEIAALIREIKPAYRSRIVLHQHHELASVFAIRRLHFTEALRARTDKQRLMELRRLGICLSTSIHDAEEYENLSACFAYTLFGPVFNSISKVGYSAALPDGFMFRSEGSPADSGLDSDPGLGSTAGSAPLTETTRPRVIAIGGITPHNIKKALKMGFSGVAALGVVWQEPDKSLWQYKNLRAAWKKETRRNNYA
jgi:thiamine-phosphate pyrophosphorylase